MSLRIEPCHSTAYRSCWQPVALILSILLWGMAWGITGMILAVPITAVLRIYLEDIKHPLTKFIAKVSCTPHMAAR